MVQVRIAGVALDPARQHVILLKPIGDLAGEGRLLPIWIGEQEATSILVAVEGAEAPRPLAHDLMKTIVDALDAEVARVDVSRVEAGTFYAEVSLSSGGDIRVVDARPSDAVALAARTGAPIFVADALLEEAGVTDTVTDEEEKESVDEFRKFLDEVEPEDFAG